MSGWFPPLPFPPLGLFPPLGGFSEAPSASSKVPPSVLRTLGMRPSGGGGSGEILPLPAAPSCSSRVGEGERETSAESGLFLFLDESEDLEEEEAVLEEELEDFEVDELEEPDL